MYCIFVCIKSQPTCLCILSESDKTFLILIILWLLILQQQKEAASTTKEATNLLDKERQDWKIRQVEMVKQIADLQEECRLVKHNIRHLNN